MRALIMILAAGVCLFPAPGHASGMRVSGQFSLSREDLLGMTSSLPRRIQDKILARPKDFLQLAAKVLDEPADFFLLVDKRHPLPADYAPRTSSGFSKTTSSTFHGPTCPCGKRSCRPCSKWRARRAGTASRW